MPNLNGFETAALIYEREKLRHIPIIFITAHNYGEENIFKGYRTGAVDYIYKPINPDLLRAKVAVFVELYRKNQRLQMQELKLTIANKNLEAEINDRKTSEEKIKALNLELLKNIDSLEDANKELDRVAFMASHDLQEPLRKICMFSDRLSSEYDGVLDERGKLFVSRIQHASRHMQMLTKDILTFAKVSTDKNSFVESDLNDLLNNVLVELTDTIREKHAIIKADKLPVLCVNPVLMQPLFHNLISNALKYNRKDIPPVITIRNEKTDELNGGSYYRILVEDNGIGFDQKYSEQIFGMFKRLHNSSEYEGTGVGLALCKKIVEEHYGFISAKSKVNEGSTFIVSLPVNASHVPLKDAKAQSAGRNHISL